MKFRKINKAIKMKVSQQKNLYRENHKKLKEKKMLTKFKINKLVKNYNYQISRRVIIKK